MIPYIAPVVLKPMLAPFVPGKSCPFAVVPLGFSIRYISVVPRLVITIPERDALAATISVAVPVTVACPVEKG